MVSEEPASPEGEQPELDVLKTAPPLSPDSDEPRLPLTRAMAQYVYLWFSKQIQTKKFLLTRKKNL